MHGPQKARGNAPPQKTFGLAADFSENRRFGRKGTRGRTILAWRKFTLVQARSCSHLTLVLGV